MKKNRSSLFLSFIVLFLSMPGFVSSAVPAAAPVGTNERIVSELDNGGRIDLRADQVLVVDREGNPSIGYLWEVVNFDIKILRAIGPVEFASQSDRLGAPVRMIYRFQAVGPGLTDLVLVYHRPWEEQTSLDRFSIQVQAVGPFAATSSSNPGWADDLTIPVGPERRDVAGSLPQDLPTAFNWCDIGGCTPVKDQGNCGSCWAFATVGPFESLIKLKDGVAKDLAEQYLVSCNTDGWGCDGGWWAHAYHKDKVPPGEPAAGAVYEADFPYMAFDLPCNPPHAHHEKLISWSYVNPSVDIPSVAEIKQAIFNHGPISVAVCVGPGFGNYRGGVFATNETAYCSGGVNHGVVLVGWDDGQGVNGIWYLRNSWGPGWGENGYMRIARGVSNVGYAATYVVYEGTRHIPLAPTNLQAKAVSTRQIDLSWIDQSNNENGFKIERSRDGVFNWNQIATVGANVRVYSDTGLQKETLYFYRVRAFNDDGDSKFSNIAEAMTFGEWTTAIYVPYVLKNGP